MLNGNKTNLAKAYAKQEEVEKTRQALRALEKTYNTLKKEFGELVKAVEDEGKKEDSFHKLMYEESSTRGINKDAFLSAFGQEKFNEAAKIGVGDAENAVGKNAVESAEGVLIAKVTVTPVIIKF